MSDATNPTQETAMDVSEATPPCGQSDEGSGDINNDEKRKLPLEYHRYEIRDSKRAAIVIISNQTFVHQCGLEERKGTEVDVRALNEAFEGLKFSGKPNVYRNQTGNEMVDNLIKEAAAITDEEDLFVCTILTHGHGDGTVYGTDGKKVAIDKLVAPFKSEKCWKLDGKPRLFFIQACRGTIEDSGCHLIRTDSGSELAQSDTPTAYRIASEADFLIAYSTVPGCVSFRSETQGSEFIQALCKELTNARGEEIMSIMSRVNYNVAYERTYENHSDADTKTIAKQMPCCTTTLTKLLYF